MTAPQQYSDEQLLAAIALAVEARDFPAVETLLRRLAVQAPDKAQAVLDLVELARVVAR